MKVLFISNLAAVRSTSSDCIIRQLLPVGIYFFLTWIESINTRLAICRPVCGSWRPGLCCVSVSSAAQNNAQLFPDSFLFFNFNFHQNLDLFRNFYPTKKKKIESLLFVMKMMFSIEN